MLHNEINFPVHNHLHLWVSTLGTRRLLALRESRGKPSVSYSSLRLVCFGGGRKLPGLSSERTRWSPRVAESPGTVFRLTSVQICFSLVQLPQNPNQILSAENLRSEVLASNRALVSRPVERTNAGTTRRVAFCDSQTWLGQQNFWSAICLRNHVISSQFPLFICIAFVA